MVEIKLLEDVDIGKKGEIVNTTKKGSDHYIDIGVAESIKIDLVPNRETAIDKIMEDKHLNREQAWKLYKQQEDQKFIEEQHTKSKKATKKEIKEYKRIRDILAKEELGDQLNELATEASKNITLNDVYKTVEKYLHVNDRNRIDLILATALSNQIPGTPIWMFIVGNSGDWKSAFTTSLAGLDNCIKVDQLTKNTLATGMKDAWDLGSDLANNSTILLFPDLASLTSMNVDEKNTIWGQFRTLYDGDILKSTGGGVKKAYENCHVTMIACTTQSIRDEILIHAQLGTRELMYDTDADEADDDFKMDMAWENEKYEEKMATDIRDTVCSFLKTRKITLIDKDIPYETKKFLKQEAKRLRILRASGMTDRKNRELINPVSPEVPTRLIKQFKRIYISLKSLDEKYPDKKTKAIISRIVDSSGNKVRMKILEFLKKDTTKKFKIIDIHKKTRIGRSSLKSQLEMLWNLGVISKDIIEERIGGYPYTDPAGYESIRGGRIEDVAYYQYLE